MNQQIWIVDFGSQYTQLITRKARELEYSSIILTVEQTKTALKTKTPHALILSGGPQSIFNDETDYEFLFEKEIPTLGICYGLQLMTMHFKGEVEKGVLGEYGPADLNCGVKISNCPNKFNAWMSHSDHVKKVPENFEIVLKSMNDLVAGIKHQTRPYLGLQFHPEVEHTEHGSDILNYFFKDIAKLKTDWNQNCILEEAKKEVTDIGEAAVLCAFSGGVDSLVAAQLSHNIIKDNLHCFFIDNGLLRPQDRKHIEVLQKETALNINCIDASEQFLTALAGVSEPEQKRKIIGKTFIDVFEKKVHEYEHSHNINFEYLLQGTLYPDVIESTSPHKKDGKSVTIKSHHNVGGLPETMKLKLLEPLKFLFKDEVRKMGVTLGLNAEWVYRHPFPGPGLGVRVLGELTKLALKQCGDADQILFEELKNFKLYDATWQALTVKLPVQTVGVKGDARAYEEVICLRMVGSNDGMTATWSEMPGSFLAKVSSRITNEVAGITRVVYDITSKPPGTIEWE